jgi:diaminopimelate epimerase
MVNFVKMNGAGNDFVIIDTRGKSNVKNIKFNHEIISRICDRSNVGCDQLIMLKDSISADILMEIYNSDGSISGACGNATRCVAALLMAEKECDEVNIKTEAGILRTWKKDGLIAVNMGKPKFLWNEIPLLTEQNTEDFVVDGFEEYPLSAVNMGNPHIIIFIDRDLSDEEFTSRGSALETNDLFPEKTNVEFAKIISKNHIEVRVWERGAGETLACGSGACSVAVAAIRNNLIKREEVKISFKGGDLFIDWREDGSVIMVGGFQKVFNGILDSSFYLVENEIA